MGAGSLPINIQVRGYDALMRKLLKLAPAAANRVNRRAVRSAVGLVATITKSQVPVDQGLLKKAQGSKVRSKKNITMGFVGADVDILRTYEAQPRTSGPGIKKLYRPTNIDWLVNFGHVAGDTDTFVLQGLIPAGTFIPGAHYMERAWQLSKAAAQSKYVSMLQSGIVNELAKT